MLKFSTASTLRQKIILAPDFIVIPYTTLMMVVIIIIMSIRGSSFSNHIKLQIKMEACNSANVCSWNARTLCQQETIP
jgi:hypothetical protein